MSPRSEVLKWRGCWSEHRSCLHVSAATGDEYMRASKTKIQVERRGVDVGHFVRSLGAEFILGMQSRGICRIRVPVEYCRVKSREW